MRIALGIEYDGSQYHGWQRQESVSSVQARVEDALSKVANEDITVFCAGRTDKGVHATSQIAHFDTSAMRENYQWMLGGNSYLPNDICLRFATKISEDFHARFSAEARQYSYIIYNGRIRPALFTNKVSWHPRPLDVELMQEAANYLIGEHDFSSFRAAECQANHPNREVLHINIERKYDLVHVDIKANAFLHHMVRNIVGVLKTIGEGKHPPQWAEEVLNARDRSAGSFTAPAEGLYFVAAFYPQEFALPNKAKQPLII